MNLNSTVACGINSCSVSSNVWQASAQKINWKVDNRIETTKNNFVSESEQNYWQDLERFNNEANYHLSSSKAIAKWDDSGLWDNFAADPTRKEAAESIMFNANRRQIKPINAQCSWGSNLVVEEEMEIDADEEPSRCSNLVIHCYRQFKKMSKIKFKQVK